METCYSERNPETCSSLGLECYGCVEHSARTVAAICHGLTTASLHSTFIQLYPSPLCAQMAPVFASAYAAASTPRKPVVRAVAA